MRITARICASTAACDDDDVDSVGSPHEMTPLLARFAIFPDGSSRKRPTCLLRRNGPTPPQRAAVVDGVAVFKSFLIPVGSSRRLAKEESLPIQARVTLSTVLAVLI